MAARATVAVSGKEDGMKRIALAGLVLVLAASFGFAQRDGEQRRKAKVQLGVGAAAFFTSPYLLGQPVNVADLNVNRFTFGGDARLKLGLFQAEMLLLYSMGADVRSIDATLDAGIGFDLLFLRLSAGVGPNFIYFLGGGGPWRNGLNAKVNADIKLGRISLGVSYIMVLTIDGGININASEGRLGANLLLWL